ncbi:MAG: OmpA family protein [Treponema sp.]|nr:OmpA family protein [Treponema sp.]
MPFSCQKRILFTFMFYIMLTGLNAQSEFPGEDFWSLDGGIGISDILVKGQSFQFIVEPKLWLSPPFMVGSKLGVNFSNERRNPGSTLGNILTFEGQVFFRWNFLRPGKPENPINIFAQIGLGLLSSYRGRPNVFDDVTETRGSLLLDAAVGVTIPLTDRWHIEPSVRAGYPHILGASVTAGYKFPLPTTTRTEYRTEFKTEYIEVIRKLPANELIKVIKIAAIEFILFGPDIGRYNIGIDRDAQQLNELVLNYVASYLKEHNNYMARIEGHANPYTINVNEADDLMALSAMRANTIAEQLRARGVSDEQMVIVAFGGTRNATSEWDVRNRNRRVELMLIHVDMD